MVTSWNPLSVTQESIRKDTQNLRQKIADLEADFERQKDGVYEAMTANGAPLQFVTDIVGVTLRVLSPQEDKYADLVVCGVYDYSPPQEWYDELFDSSSAENDYSARLSVFENNLFNGFYCLALVSDSFYEANYRWYNIAEDPYEYGMEQ